MIQTWELRRISKCGYRTGASAERGSIKWVINEHLIRIEQTTVGI